MKFFNINKTDINKNILYNKYLLYFIFFISFGNFFIELMKSNMYFIAIYILIGFLTSFFNKNMIVILSMAVIFANILNYGRISTVEGYEDEEDEEQTDLDKALGTKKTEDDGIIDEIVGEDEHEHEDNKKKKKKKTEPDSDDEDTKKKKNKKKKEGLTQLTDQAVLEMNYAKAEKLMDQQKDILKNLNQYKPFLETIQGIAKSSGIKIEK